MNLIKQKGKDCITEQTIANMMAFYEVHYPRENKEEKQGQHIQMD